MYSLQVKRIGAVFKPFLGFLKTICFPAKPKQSFVIQLFQSECSLAGWLGETVPASGKPPLHSHLLVIS